MGKVLALTAASWQSAKSYRLNLFFSIASLLVTVIPLYFVSQAIQPIIADAISAEGGEYFGFLIVGMMVFLLISWAVSSLPGAIGSGVGSGTLEAMLATPTRLPTLLAGLVGYSFLWTMLKAALLLTAAVVLGAQIAIGQIVPAVTVLALIILAHLSFGIAGAAMMLAFRTTGPMIPAVLAVSALLGGVYYPTRVIPSWLRDISDVLPLSYGLRALRRLLLDGAPVSAVASDVGVLVAFTVVLLGGSSLLMIAALRYARRAGTLSQY